MSKRSRFLLVLAAMGGVLLLTAVPAFAANGQVAGSVIDKSIKEPIIGARVRLLLEDGVTSAKLGAISDLKGNFLINNVPPGKYVVEVSYGSTYTKQVFKDVKVETDRKYEIGIAQLAPTAIQGDTVEVIAGRKAEIRKEVATSQVKVAAEEIEKLPIRNVTDLLKLQVGVTFKDDQIHIRGGRHDETVFIIDGVQVRNILTGSSDRGQVQSSNMGVSTAGIQEFTLIKGGFDAQYGNATSGVVSISTKEGSTDRTRFHVEYFTDRFGSPTLNKYSFNSDQVQFNLSGPEPFLNWVFPKFLKWNTEGKVAYFASVAMDKTDTHLSYNKLASPTTQKQFATTSILGITIPDRSQNTYNTQLKFTIRPSGLLKLNADWKGEYLRYNLVGRNLQWGYRYSPATAQVINDQTNTFSVSAEHTLSKNTFYRAQISHYAKRFVERPGDPDNPGQGRNPDLFNFDDQSEIFQDGTPDLNYVHPDLVDDLDLSVFEREHRNGRWDEGEPFIDIDREDTTNSGAPIYTPPDPSSGFAGDAFEDVNGNGVYDPPEAFTDTNDNGRFDYERRDVTGVDNPEPFQDGDLILGEPFIDMDKDGRYNPAVDRFITCICPENQDLNFNSQFDGAGSTYSTGIPYRDLNGNGVYDPPDGAVRQPGEPFIDANGNGVYDYGNDGFVDPNTYLYTDPITGNVITAYQRHGVDQTTFKFDLNSQVSSHYLSTGLQLDLTKLTMNDIRGPQFHYTGTPDFQDFPDRGITRDFYVKRPLLGDIYVGDRVEYGQLIANLSLRYDFFFQSTGLNTVRAVEILGDKVPDPVKNKFSPRMGFSYPISERAKLFFNYGHYYQLPNLNQFYRRSNNVTSGFGTVGNFNLDYTKKIKYEFGSEVLLSSNYRAVLTGFYNDDFGLINSLVNRYGSYSRDEYVNTDYGRTRGVEAEISKVGGGYIQGYLDYQYSIALGKSSSETSNFLDRLQGREISIQEFPLDWDQRHQVTMNVNINVPNGDHPQLFGLRMPDNWNLNVIWQYGSGFPFTPSASYPGLPSQRTDASRKNSLRLPANSRVDVRFQKAFRVWRQDYTCQLWINNLFDRKNVADVWSNTGRPYTNLSFEDPVTRDFTAFTGTPFMDDPRNYETGRNIKMGLSVDF
ncbi:MAG: TonB-dependent receptor [candidate division Zixibacteria bacterium]|nr:TonB-dependent receptor [candidate division Zixibacteria bacterium]